MSFPKSALSKLFEHFVAFWILNIVIIEIDVDFCCLISMLTINNKANRALSTETLTQRKERQPSDFSRTIRNEQTNIRQVGIIILNECYFDLLKVYSLYTFYVIFYEVQS